MAGGKPIRVPIGKTGYFLSSSARKRLSKIKSVDQVEIWNRMALERRAISSMDTSVYPEELPQMKRLYARTNAKLSAQRLRNMVVFGTLPDTELVKAVRRAYLDSSTFGQEYGEHYLQELRKMRLIAKPVKLKK